MSTTIKAIILGIAALFAVRYVLSKAVRHVVTTATTDYAANCLSVIGHTTRVQDGVTYIVGTFKNGCDRRFSQVTLKFQIDPSSRTAWTPFASGVKDDRAPRAALDLPSAPIFAYRRDVQPGETREFKSAYRIPENAIYRFERVSGF
jgi:hypothetical protein